MIRTATRAFTMIELVMSLAMGLAIILTIYAGFRQMAEGIKNAEAMALDNDLLNAGIFQALEEVDSWSSTDNPSWQPLRTSSGSYKELDVLTGNYAADGSDWDELPQPFNHFDDTAAASRTADTYYAFYFEPHDKRSWYRGDGGCYFDEDQKYCWESSYGNYSLFANSSDNYVLVGHTDHGEGYDAFLIVPASHRYLGAQHELFKYSLGWYGWLDYLPAHAFVDYYDKYGDYGKLGHTNNGHGNNDDGVDSSNPGNAPFNDTDPTYDDETQSQHKNGSKATVTGIKPWELRDLPQGKNGDSVDAMQRHGQLVLQKADWVSPLTKSGAERAVTPGWYLYGSHIGISAPRPGASATEMVTASPK